MVGMLVTGLFLLVLGALITGFAWYDADFVRFNRDRLDRLAAEGGAPGRLTVVALGDSALKHATRDEADMADLGRKAGIPDLRFLRITYDAGIFADFHPLLDRVLEVRPDIVLIQMDFLFRVGAWNRHFPVYLRNLVSWAVHGTPVFANPWDTQYSRRCTHDGVSGLVAHSFPHLPADTTSGVTVEPRARAYGQVMAFAGKAQARGIRVALIQLRGSSRFQAPFFAGHDDDPSAPTRLRKDPASAAATLPLWPFPSALVGDRNFCDVVHMTDASSRVYAGWLAQALARETAPP